MIKIDHLDFSHHHKVRYHTIHSLPYTCGDHLVLKAIKSYDGWETYRKFSPSSNILLHLQEMRWCPPDRWDVFKKGKNETSLKCGISFVKYFIGDDVRKCIALKMQSDERSNLIHVEYASNTQTLWKKDKKIQHFTIKTCTAGKSNSIYILFHISEFFYVLL